MFKKLAIVVALCGAAMQASADNVVGGLSYSRFSDEISLSTVNASIGYKFEVANQFYLIPEIRFGVGVDDDSYQGVDAEITNHYGAALRGQLELNNGVYLFAAPSYMDLEIDTNFGSGSSAEWGIGAGVGVMFNEQLGAELSYETYDGTDVYGVGLRFNF